MVKDTIGANDIELSTITTDEDIEKTSDREMHIIKVNDVEVINTYIDEDSDSLSDLLMDMRTRTIWQQYSSSMNRISMIVCFISYLFMLTSFVTIYLYILSDIISTDDKMDNGQFVLNKANESGDNVSS